MNHPGSSLAAEARYCEYVALRLRSVLDLGRQDDEKALVVQTRWIDCAAIRLLRVELRLIAY